MYPYAVLRDVSTFSRARGTALAPRKVPDWLAAVSSPSQPFNAGAYRRVTHVFRNLEVFMAMLCRASTTFPSSFGPRDEVGAGAWTLVSLY
jgi:hypothetical protein